MLRPDAAGLPPRVVAAEVDVDEGAAVRGRAVDAEPALEAIVAGRGPAPGSRPDFPPFFPIHGGARRKLPPARPLAI